MESYARLDHSYFRYCQNLIFFTKVKKNHFLKIANTFLFLFKEGKMSDLHAELKLLKAVCIHFWINVSGKGMQPFLSGFSYDGNRKPVHKIMMIHSLLIKEAVKNAQILNEHGIFHYLISFFNKCFAHYFSLVFKK